MKEIFAGLLAAGLALFINDRVLKTDKKVDIIYISPILEETIKTLTAYYLDAFIPIVHIIFGLIEGVYDIKTSPKNSGTIAAFISVISHGIYGFLTLLVFNTTGSLIAGLIMAYTVHCLWNKLIIEGQNN